MREDSGGEEEEGEEGTWEREGGQGLACPSPPGSPKPEGPWDWRPVARRRRASAKASSSEEEEDEDDNDEEEDILTKLYRIKLD